MKVFVLLAIFALASFTMAANLHSQSKLEAETCMNLPKCACQKDIPAFLGTSTHAKKLNQIGSLSPQEFNNKLYSPKSKNMNFLATSAKAAVKQKFEAAMPAAPHQKSRVAEFLAMYQENGSAVSFLETGDSYTYWEVDGTIYYKYVGIYREHDPESGFFAWTTTTCTETYERDNETIEGSKYVSGDKQLVWYDSDDLSGVINEAETYGYYVYDYESDHSYFVPAQFTSDDVRVNWEPWYWVFDSITSELTQEELNSYTITYDDLVEQCAELGYGFSTEEIQYVFTVIDESDNNVVTMNELIRQAIRIHYAEIADQVLDSCINEDGSSVDGNQIDTDVISYNEDGTTSEVEADLDEVVEEEGVDETATETTTEEAATETITEEASTETATEAVQDNTEATTATD